MGEESVKKSRVRRQKQKEGSVGSNAPATVVCTASGPNSNNIELGLIVSLIIVVVYSFGFYRSVISVPDVTQQSFNVKSMQTWYQHMGQNLNVARSEFTETTRLPAGGGQQQQQRREEQESPPVSGTGKLNMPYGVPESDVVIPPHKWPVTVRDEEFEPLLHSGDEKTVIMVPKLWSLPVHNYELMTREKAMKIGSCSEPDANGNVVRGDDCPLDQRTIYVAIASYRDFECRTTVEDIFNRAKNPDRIRVGVVDQIAHGEDPLCNEPIKDCSLDQNQALCRWKDRIDVVEMEAELSIGPVFARHIGSRLYRGEYYATQSDAHVSYTQNWDVDIIDQLEQSKNEMAVLSTYLTDVQGSISPEGKSLRQTRPIMCNTVYEGGPQGLHLRHASQPEMVPSIHGEPQLQPWWAAGYSFSRGHFVVNVPYDWLQPMIFQGEEMSIGIRGFTIGYDFYAPERSVCFHHYAVGKNKNLRNKVKHFWENGDRYAGTGKKAMTRLLGIVHMNPEVPVEKWNHMEEDIYGIGEARKPEKFYEIFGIDVTKKTIEGHLCSFVHEGGKMHHEFTPHLRSDGMGIDYSQVNYQFKDPRPGQQ